MRNALSRSLHFSLRTLCLGCIWLYQHVLSESFKYFIGGTCHTCRFYPTCSEYARDAFSSYSVFKGFWYTLRRLAKCHPWHQGGLDLLPKKNLN